MYGCLSGSPAVLAAINSVYTICSVVHEYLLDLTPLLSDTTQPVVPR